MITVVRPAAPAILLSEGRAATRELCEKYLSAPKDYQSGLKIFEFDDAIYGSKAVKGALRSGQYNKCAFCESFFAHVGYGDVEHFRPKGGYKQRDSDNIKRPGYYWLAYEWDNLYYSCQLCNQRFKRNLFPLKDGRHRARSHQHDLGKEKPLLVDPAKTDPAIYIGMREEYAYAVGGCHEGLSTIDVLGLNREELVEVRRDRLKMLVFLAQFRDLLLDKIKTGSTVELLDSCRGVEETLQASRGERGVYAAMARAYFDSLAPSTK